jgi:hypothetical protein
MKPWTETERDVTSLVGIGTGIGALLAACLVPDIAFLAAPALAVLLAGLLLATR